MISGAGPKWQAIKALDETHDRIFDIFRLRPKSWAALPPCRND